MLYRTWTYADIGEIAALEQQCFSDPWSFQMLADSFISPNTATIAAEEGGEVVGYAFLTGIAGEEADLANIAVDARCRGRGVGGELLRRLEERARQLGVRRIFLEVRVSNADAMLLYLRHGYVGKYVRSRYYGDGEDAVVMWKEI